MERHRQGSYSSINCLADLLLPHLTGTGRGPASSGIMLWLWECWTWGSLTQVRHRKGTSHHSVSLGQKCLLPSVPITAWQDHLQLPSHPCLLCSYAVCCAELAAGSSSRQDTAAHSQGICTVPRHTPNLHSFTLVQPLILKTNDSHKPGMYSINNLKINAYKLSIMIVPPII